jgi:hypothetical protein
MVKIAFWPCQLCVRGTSVAVFDYAYYNQKILGNESIILYNINRKDNNGKVVEKFKREFTVYGLQGFHEVDNKLKELQCDIFYIIKPGFNEGQVSRVCKTIVHCVFDCYDPHGEVYVCISPWVRGFTGQFPVVPHMINLPSHNRNMRKELNIPDNACVFGQYGGYDSFDIEYAQISVYEVARQHPNIYFIFVNARPFCEPLPNLIHYEIIIDLDKKVEFINTCDAMIWGRLGGESFGLCIAEFSTKNKPVICTNSGYDAHIHLLGDKAILYDETNLYEILVTFDKEEMETRDWNAYQEYTPEKVIEIFKRVCID